MIFDTPPHLLFLALPLFAINIFWLLYIFLICPSIISPIVDDRCRLIVNINFALLIIIFFWDWRNNWLILTNRKVIQERGIIGKSIMSIELDQIQDIKVSFGIFGRIFGFGTIEIESAGTYGKIVFRGIPFPKRVKRLIELEVKRWG